MMDWIEDLRARYCADLLLGFSIGRHAWGWRVLLDIARVKKAAWNSIHVHLLALAKSLYSYSQPSLDLLCSPPLSLLCDDDGTNNGKRRREKKVHKPR
jgi:hypothetical protein